MQYNQGRTSILQRTWRRMFSFIFNFLCDTTPEGDNSVMRRGPGAPRSLVPCLYASMASSMLFCSPL
jgi:hypothetical protein